MKISPFVISALAMTGMTSAFTTLAVTTSIYNRGKGIVHRAVSVNTDFADPAGFVVTEGTANPVIAEPVNLNGVVVDVEETINGSSYNDVQAKQDLQTSHVLPVPDETKVAPQLRRRSRFQTEKS